MNVITDSITAQGYGGVEQSAFAPQDFEALYATFDGFAELCIEDSAFKDAFNFKPDASGVTAYYFKNSLPGLQNTEEQGRGVHRDDKYLFHYSPWAEQIARERIGQDLPPEAEAFLKLCKGAYYAGYASVRQLARAYDQDEVINDDPAELTDMRSMLRVLAYRRGNNPLPSNTESDELLAVYHWDRSVFTAALHANASGLVGAPADNLSRDRAYLDDALSQARHSPIPDKPAEAQVFIGGGFRYLGPEAQERFFKLRAHPLLHGVVDPVEALPNGIRNAAVFFGQPSGHYLENPCNRYQAAPTSELQFLEVYEQAA